MKTSAKKPAVKNKKTINRKVIVLALLVAVIALGIFIAYRAQQNRAAEERAFQADKARFAEVEKDLKSLHDALTTIDTPIQESTNKSCAYKNLKYEKGDLLCYVTYNFKYAAQPFSKVLGDINQVEQIIGRSEDFKLTEYSRGRPFTLTEHGSAYQRVGFDMINAHVEACNIEIQLSSQDQGRVNTPTFDQSYQIKCSGPVQQPVYSLAE